MSNTAFNSEETTSHSELIVKLCNHFSKNDSVLSAKLSKIAFNFLSKVSATNLNGPSDEQYLIGQIKQILLAKSAEDAENFELLYTKICRTNVLQNRASVLSFLLNLANTSTTSTTTTKWPVTEELEKIPSLVKLRTNLKSDSSQESIKNLFQAQSKASTQSLWTNIRKPSQLSPFSTISCSTKTNVESISSKSSYCLVSDRDLLQDVIYSFQGIEGKFLRREMDGDGLGFIVDPKAGKNFTKIQYGLVERLVGISFLHNQLKQYCDNNDKQSGIICQALIATLRNHELSDYYKTVAMLQAAMEKQSCTSESEITLRKALVYMHTHRTRFEWLAYITEQCTDKKGGALISAIHGFLQHGSKCAQEVSEKVLTAVCKPLFIMLSRWLLDGEINDPNYEFFIEARNITTAERLWHDKYHVRKAMVPSFITLEQANKILATGKSINFLRQICKDNGQLPGRDSLKKLFLTTPVNVLFTIEESLEFHSILDKVYRETSLRVLDLLKNKYRLLEHLHSLRKYMLLGQGDFIRHLLELLAPELNKPAQDIYWHTLNAILESAVRVTNAQYEDEDTLKRLNVNFLSHSMGDSGWEVFSLTYIVDGPVSTIFQPSMPIYHSLFGSLWKAKRLEFVLGNMRKQQITISKMFKSITELKPVFHIIHILTSEMIHFLHQTQYYFLFEILECSWTEMLRQVDQAECLDDVIKAHTTFLNSVKCGVLLDENSKNLCSQLFSIYSFVLQLESYQDSLFIAASNEFDAQMELLKKSSSTTGFGLTRLDDIKTQKRIATFEQFLKTIKTQVNHLVDTYNEFVKNYLKLLSSSSNMNLQLLSVRLSFNDYYRVT